MNILRRNNQRPGYILLNVLIVILFLTTFSILRYRYFEIQHRVYTKMHDELLSQTMANLVDENSSKTYFNTGEVENTDKSQTITLKNGYRLIINKAHS